MLYIVANATLEQLRRKQIIKLTLHCDLCGFIIRKMYSSCILIRVNLNYAVIPLSKSSRSQFYLNSNTYNICTAV